MLVLVETHRGARLVLQVSPDVWSQLQELMPLVFRRFSNNLIYCLPPEVPCKAILG